MVSSFIFSITLHKSQSIIITFQLFHTINNIISQRDGNTVFRINFTLCNFPTLFRLVQASSLHSNLLHSKVRFECQFFFKFSSLNVLKFHVQILKLIYLSEVILGAVLTRNLNVRLVYSQDILSLEEP